MFGTFFSYFVIFFITARLLGLTGKISWMPTVKTTAKRDALLATIFSLVAASLILFPMG